MAEENINEYIDDEIDEGQQQLYEHFRFEVDPGQVATRVDKFMCEKLQHSSRNRIQKAADAGYVHVNDHPVKSNHKVRPGDVVTLMLDRPRFETSIEPEDIPLDIVYEDDDLMVINKPAGMVVHPGCGNFTGTLVNAIAWHLRDIPSYDPNDPQVGLVHRIDKDTSGLLIVAKNDFAHIGLSEQIKAHSFEREYQTVVYGGFKTEGGTVDAPIGRHSVDRKKMCVTEKNSKPAVTHYEVIERYSGFTHLRVHLETGRTHQIRVHMSHIGHPIMGDTVYGGGKTPFEKAHKSLIDGQMLHAKELSFPHPRTKEIVRFECPLPDNFEKILDILKETI